MAKKALVLLAEGAEEMEAVITIDVLRRGGVEVTVAGLAGSEVVKCSRGVLLKPDTDMDSALKAGVYDAVVMPGGMGGAKALAADDRVGALLCEQEKSGRICGAICAAPIALNSHGIGKGRQLTSHPVAMEELSSEAAGYKYSEERVVQDGTLITSRGPGTAMEFALKLVEALVGAEKVAEISPPMLVK